ncbi:MAG: ABC transporter ATP-binding protein, partial [Oscillospiraceae bacterium]|nr:ABC transporter ATP-binding protein [Oscillospiraceae bacterium]
MQYGMNMREIKGSDEAKFKSGVLIRLWKYLYEHKWLVFLAIFLSVASNVLSLLGPVLSGRAIDAIEPGKGHVDFKKVFFYCALMVVFYALSSAMMYLLSATMVTLSQKVIVKMRKDVFEKLVDLPVGYFDKNKTGDLISRITYDIDTVNTSLSNDLVQICASVITVFGSLFMMIAISPVMVLVFAVTIPASIAFTKFMTNKVRPLFRKRSAKLGELNGFVEEMVSGHKTIKAYGREKVMLERFDERNLQAVDAYYNAEYYGSMVGPSINFINNLSLSLVSVFGALMYLFSMLSLGNIASFLLYSRKFSGPINEFANIISELQSALAAAERVFKLIDEEPEKNDIEGAHVFEKVEGNVEIKDVSFGYTPEKTIIKDLNLKAEKGRLIAIAGPTGAGKTTII